MEIRTAVVDDLPELQRVFAAASLSNEGDSADLREHPEFLAFAGDHIDSGRTRVAVPGDHTHLVLGFATIVPGADGEPELEDLFVDPDARRRGIARRLVADAVSDAEAAGQRRIWVTGNEHALDFYRAVGFEIVGVADTELRSAPRLRLDVVRSTQG
jgi:ribosomal protein S18 acetylase RimI-like enzyme